MRHLALPARYAKRLGSIPGSKFAHVNERIDSCFLEKAKCTTRLEDECSNSKVKSEAENGRGSSTEKSDEQYRRIYTSGTVFEMLKSTIDLNKVSSVFSSLKDANLTDFARRGIDVLKGELYDKSGRKNYILYSPSTFKGELSSKTDVVIQPSQQSWWVKKFSDLREKMQSHPFFKQLTGFSEPVVNKSQEIAEDMRERWETSDSPVVHKIQDVSETIFQETDAASTFKEISTRDPSFSLPDFVADVQDIIRPVLNAYIRGDTNTLRKFCTPEVIIRCEAERNAFQSSGIFMDNKILHISEAEVRETKMLSSSPIIIIVFQTQQIHCVRDRHGSITEGGKDTIHTVFYAWAMQQMDREELGKDALYPIWKLRDIQQLGMKALI